MNYRDSYPIYPIVEVRKRVVGEVEREEGKKVERERLKESKCLLRSRLCLDLS